MLTLSLCSIVCLCVCLKDISPYSNACMPTLPVCTLLSVVVYVYCHFGLTCARVGGMYAMIVAACVMSLCLICMCLLRYCSGRGVGVFLFVFGVGVMMLNGVLVELLSVLLSKEGMAIPLSSSHWIVGSSSFLFCLGALVSSVKTCRLWMMRLRCGKNMRSPAMPGAWPTYFPVSYRCTMCPCRFVFVTRACAVHPQVRKCDTSGGMPVRASYGDI